MNEGPNPFPIEGMLAVVAYGGQTALTGRRSSSRTENRALLFKVRQLIYRSPVTTFEDAVFEV